MALLEETQLGVFKRSNTEAPRATRDRLFGLAGFDVQFVAAEGDYLYWQDEMGNSRRALDLAGGGARLLGHNHPEMVAAALRHLHEKRPVLALDARGSTAGALKTALAHRVGRETGRDYEVILCTTRAEAMEAAIEHARLELGERQRAARARLLAQLRELERRATQGKWAPDAAFFRRCESALGMAPIQDLDALTRALLHKDASAFGHAGHLVAMDGGFFGPPQDGAAWNLGPRSGARSPMSLRVLRPGDKLERVLGGTNELLYELELDPPTIACASFSTIAAVVVEPIRSENGTEIEGALVRSVNALRAAHPEIPIVVDESECGLGRTGNFLEGPARALPCDYVIVGHALGGGVAKLAAVAIDRARHVECFATSSPSWTDSGLSFAVGSACLTTIERDHVAERCAQTGFALLAELVKMARCWPGQIGEVRGRGMMLSVEFREQSNNRSAVMRALDQEGLLVGAVAGFLLRRRDVRVLPTATPGRVLRLEPSAYLDFGEIERIGLALGEVAAILEAGDAFSLLAHLAHRDPNGRESSSQSQVRRIGRDRRNLAMRSSIELVGHLIDNEPVVTWDPSLGHFRSDELAIVIDRLAGILPRELLETRTRSSRHDGASHRLATAEIRSRHKGL